MRYAAIAGALLGQVFVAGMTGAAQSADRSASAATAVPRAVQMARTTAIPRCTVFVDGAAAAGDGSVQRPHKTIAAAVDAAQAGAVICVAEGAYPEELKPGEQPFTLAGGFQRGSGFKVRDSATYVSHAKGNGSGSFLRIEDPGPKGDVLTAIDGFEISGYSQAIVRDFYEPQRFDVTNNLIHDNVCAAPGLAGGGVAVNNVTGSISGNVFVRNTCGRGGAIFVNDDTNRHTVRIENNLVDANAGVEPETSHGGAVYLFGNKLFVTGNTFTNNTVTGWGAGLFVGAYTPGGQFTSATLSWNYYRGNKAGVAGGGFFCDENASCASDHEIYYANCGGNIYLDSGPAEGPGATMATFDRLTNAGALDVDCRTPGLGVRIDKEGDTPDSYAFRNAIFWGNAANGDIAANCEQSCKALTVSVSQSMVQTGYTNGGVPVRPGAANARIAFASGNIAPADPLFADLQAGDFHLKSSAGRWTPAGYVRDAVTSPAIGKGDGGRSELGAYGGSPEASSPGGAAPAPVAAAAPIVPATSAPATPAVSAPPAAAVDKAAASRDERAQPAQAAETDDVTAREAFEAAKELGTIDAWNAFIGSFPNGFRADLARAYIKSLGEGATAPAAMPAGTAPAPVRADAPTVELGANANLNGVRLLPDDSPWHQDISKAPVDRNSARILARIGNKPLHPDFGPVWEGAPIGIPYVVVPGTQPRVPMTFTEAAEESDAGPYPIPPDAPIEGGPKGDGDRHILVLDRDNWMLYEVFNAFRQPGGGWKAGSGAIWDLKKNQVRPDRWTSADAAGLPILPGLVRYDEVMGAGAVEHALRFTLAKTRRAYVPPASHWASKLHDEDLPPMGMRVRLKADYDISGFAPEVQVILRALKTYGMILADNGSDNYISGAHDPRWDPDILRQVKRVTTRDLEIVEMTGMVVDRR